MAAVLSALGVLLVLAGAVMALLGALFVPQLVIGGLFLLIGLAIERWRYKPIVARRPAAGWSDTGERFVDPETGKLTAVYFDPTSGERHYIAIDA